MMIVPSEGRLATHSAGKEVSHDAGLRMSSWIRHLNDH
jgi:hypothetical protein